MWYINTIQVFKRTKKERATRKKQGMRPYGAGVSILALVDEDSDISIYLYLNNIRN